MKLSLRYIAAGILASLFLTGCHATDEWADDPYGNFDALWTTLDTHYCYFAEKDIDWTATGNEFRARLRPEMTNDELFTVMAAMLDRLHDGHTNLASGFNVSYYHKWWSDYPQNYDSRLVEQYYLNFDWRTASGLIYGLLPQNIGYIRYDSFSSKIGQGNLEYVLQYLSTADALIIDIRNNGGGDLTNVETLVSRFITERTLAGYITHKSGPGHDDFSEPYAYYIDPAPAGCRIWGKPVGLLVNRSTFSAANNFTAIMATLPQVKIIGSTTGGGGAMPFTSMLPNGWTVRFSSSPLLDAHKHSVENGISPSSGCAVDLDPIAALSGTDTMINCAIDILTK